MCKESRENSKMGAVVDEFKHWDGGLGIDENPFSEIQ